MSAWQAAESRRRTTPPLITLRATRDSERTREPTGPGGRAITVESRVRYPLWDGTGYRSGALLVDESQDRVGVSLAFDGESYTLSDVHAGGGEWQAPRRSVRLANNKERQALGLSPRSVGQ